MINYEELWQQWYEEEEPLRRELVPLGFTSKYVFDIRHEFPDYGKAIPIIFSHLQRQYSDQLHESLARLLAHPAAFQLWPDLLFMYREADKNSSPRMMDGLAVALSEHCIRSRSSELRQEVIKLLRDRTRGESRLFFLNCFRRKRDEESMNLIDELSTDPDLKKEIAAWKRKPR